jgi:hypothetical protein
VSDYDYEMWYGDKSQAKEMKKEQLDKKYHFGLKYLNIGGIRTNLAGYQFKPKVIAA